jgi:hypothetical protein
LDVIGWAIFDGNLLNWIHRGRHVVEIGSQSNLRFMDFGSEMQDSSDFETPDFLISDLLSAGTPLDVIGWAFRWQPAQLDPPRPSCR